MEDNESDTEFARRVDGLFYGQLDDQELADVDRLVQDGVLRREWVGAAGLLGLSTVRYVATEPRP